MPTCCARRSSAARKSSTRSARRSRWVEGSRRLEQLVPRAELDPRATELLARGPLELVDRRPAGVDDRLDPALAEQRLDRVRRRLGVVREATGLDVLEQTRDRVGRVLLVRSDDPRRAALDPTRAIGPLGAGHAAAVVPERPAGVVERDIG